MNRHALLPLPEADAADACRQLGLAISNASVYGITHAVTVNAQTAAYELLENLMDRYGNLEWCTCEDGLLLNGNLLSSLRGTGLVVLDQMRSGKLQSFMFTSPFIRNEFSRFLALFSNAEGSGKTPDGIRAAPFQSIQLDAAAYERAGELASGTAGKTQQSPVAAEKAEPGPKRGGRRVFDLDSELDALGTEDMSAPMWPPPVPSADIATGVTRYLEQRRENLSQKAAMTDLIHRCEGDPAALDTLRDKLLAGGLSSGEWQALLEESGLKARGFPSRHRKAPVAHTASRRHASHTSRLFLYPGGHRVQFHQQQPGGRVRADNRIDERILPADQLQPLHLALSRDQQLGLHLRKLPFQVLQLPVAPLVHGQEHGAGNVFLRHQGVHMLEIREVLLTDLAVVDQTQHRDILQRFLHGGRAHIQATAIGLAIDRRHTIKRHVMVDLGRERQGGHDGMANFRPAALRA